ncbi:uncharacterized protein SPPG_06079 [Spizellomyces punctatus DAOM BR117]|uniref:Golgi SNAP receptor complex member 1 n=1 Tax=Spizellomyces punctatus (strain DAOM BR117) TaxID=645134 RepID=A0A0L0HBQ8_SPIPD|nr:uncharacterized protein SPPG_06079 [Spizellomyces punctatus DAOM BR117]KNC98371.1 hypothetical protein SPPG_06079 [Spizellomyces punctatus DAOM BR117]|eukprot:XP_016606411.1 hypothetical protein SPPG_06079 [Spizellomyces punctatus DAOM BR117]
MSFRTAAHSYSSVPDTVIPIPSAASLSPLADGSPTAAAATASAATWETLRRQARHLENEIEAKLVQYSKLGSGTGTSGFASSVAGVASSSAARSPGSTKGAELELDHLLAKLTSVVNSMAQSLDSVPSSVPTNPSMMHMLQRHRDILYDYSKEFKRTKANITAARDHADLLSSVREDISSYRSPGMGMQDYLLTERGKIDGSHRMADEVLEQAYTTRAELHDQRSVLYNTRGRMGGVLARFPLVNDLISRIGAKKRRDSLIMAGVISFCVCFLVWYWLRRF